MNETVEERALRLSGQGGWIGVDLDGTLATYDGWKGPEHIGLPVHAMAQRVRTWLAQGIEVRIVTARADPSLSPVHLEAVRAWVLAHFDRLLPITNQKDFRMIELWDDRCVQIIRNTGERVDGLA